MIPKNLNELVTFIPNKQTPIYNWFYYKEGYARDLVKWLVREFNLQEPVLDPFCGVGTTLLAAKEAGMKAIGFDVSPLALLAAKAKTRNYNIQELERQLQELQRIEPKQIGKFPNPKIRKLFREKNLDDIYFYHKKILEMQSEKERDFFLLALIDTTARVANVIKQGGSLRKAKKPFLPVKNVFLGKTRRMIADLKQTRISGPEPIVQEQDARAFSLEPESIGSIITSPPYLNKIEYSSVYKLELGLFFGAQETRLRAFIADGATGRDTETKLPLIAKAYFEDMEKTIQNCFNALKRGGKCIIVVGGGCFPYETIESDDVLIEIAETIGFKLVQKIVARKVNCMRNRTINVGTARESVIVLEKPSA